MKQYVCDFCDAVNLGYKKFKKEFKNVRHARKLAKRVHFDKTPVNVGLDKNQVNSLKYIRETASKTFDPDWIEKNKDSEKKD